MGLLCRKKPFQRSRLSSKMLMRGTGHNIVAVGVENKYWQYMSDLYTTLIDIKWRWNMLIFISSFVLIWVAFACFYYLQAYVHGDMEDQVTHTPCMQNVQTFTAAYLFSIETMTTIGYGFRYQTEDCPGVLIAVMLQSIIGAGLQFALASLVVSKTRRTKRRGGTILFSSLICIHEHDGRLQLVIRIGDMRKSEIAGAHATGFLVKKYRTDRGHLVPVRMFPVNFRSESGREDIFFPWPTQIIHKVDEDSPLWSLSRDDLLNGQYELIVVIDGLCGANSNSFQARKSYLTSEMKWGFRFSTLNLKFSVNGSYEMDLSNFHHVVPASTALCSAQDLNNLRELCLANHPKPTPKNRYQQKCSTSGRSQSNQDTRPTQPNAIAVPEPRRSHSLEERRVSLAVGERKTRTRRCSLGDMIRTSRGIDVTRQESFGDALNFYRHRRSVTDTYLGIEEEIEDDDDEDSSQAILTVVSQRSQEKRTDVRDVFKKRRNSKSTLFFGPELTSGDDTS